MPRARSPNRDKAKQLWLESGKTRKLSDIAADLGVSETQVRKWKNQDKWEKVTLPNAKGNVTKRGGQPNNQNAAGNSGGPGAPPGNKRPVKHGAYESIYLDALPDEERALYERIPDADSLAEEIRLLRLKLSRLVSQETMTTYDADGNKHTHKMTEQERTAGIMACTDALRKLIKAHKQLQVMDDRLNGDGIDQMEADVIKLLKEVRRRGANA
ncbi:MAG: phage terminase small subunit [Oscillospiraceae bacterium]